jgi:hypothetical protein
MLARFRFSQDPLQQRIAAGAIVTAFDERVFFGEGFDHLIGIFGPHRGVENQLSLPFRGF